MSKFVLGGFFLIFFIAAVVFTVSFEYTAVDDSDNETSVQNATRNAMTEAVNWGEARVNENITINQDIAVEAVVRQYAQTSDFFDGDRYLNVYRTITNPPMLAVESYTNVKTPFNRIANKFNKQNNSDENITRSRDIEIVEAKELVKN